MITIQKLDKRFDGYRFFKYRAMIVGSDPYDRATTMYNIMKWMTETYGNSIVLHNYAYVISDLNNFHNDISDKWSWTDNDYKMVIYIKDDTVLNWFRLKWC